MKFYLEENELIEIKLENEIPKREVGFLYNQAILKENLAVEGFMSYIREQL